MNKEDQLKYLKNFELGEHCFVKISEEEYTKKGILISKHLDNKKLKAKVKVVEKTVEYEVNPEQLIKCHKNKCKEDIGGDVLDELLDFMGALKKHYAVETYDNWKSPPLDFLKGFTACIKMIEDKIKKEN